MPKRKQIPTSGKKGTKPSAESGDLPTKPSAESSDLHRLLVESVNDYAIFALDPDGIILSWNGGARQIKGYTPEEIIGKHFSVFYPRELVEEGFPEFELRTAANTGHFEDEGWRIRKDGSRFWANVVITAVRDATGKLLGFAKVTRDLTERREAEESLRESEERFRLLVEGVRDYAIFMLDPTGRVATWNEGAERIKGYRAKEIIGRHFSEFYSAEDKAARKPERELEIATRTGKYEEEGWRVRRNGETFWASVLITAIRNKSGELVGFAKVTRDLTERRAAEQLALENARQLAAEEAARNEAEVRERQLRDLSEELRQQAATLEARTNEAEEAHQHANEANRAKTQFLAAMSHELRTPLNAIGGYTDLLTMGLSGPVTPQQTEQLDRIRRSQQHLLGIINDILNFSRIEAGQLTYDIAPVAVRDIAVSVTQMMMPQARAKRIRLDDEGCRNGAIVLADRSKAEQIVINLVSNAIKFTESGGTITLSCKAEDGKDRVVLLVRDTGGGIPEDKLGAIFEPFVQVGRTLTNTREGAGLGLAISRDLARAMGGDITVDSKLGVGSEFRLVLPADRPS